MKTSPTLAAPGKPAAPVKGPAGHRRPAEVPPAAPRPSVRWFHVALGLAAAAAVLVWVFWPSLVELAEVWETDPQYSHGYLVPVFALVLLWLRRDQCDWAAFRPSWWGLPLIAAACLLRLAGGYYYYFWLERVALVPAVAGLAVALGGGKVLRWSWPSVLFLLFMLPLPSRLAEAMSGPLQRVGTVASSYLLEVCGIPAVTEGNVILLREVDLGVVEACSGMRMLITFFAASAAFTLFVKRSLWVRVPLFLSAVPIALVVNIVRITVTGVLYEKAGTRLAELVFHDLAGWLMIPLALALLWLTCAFLTRLVVPADPQDASDIQDSLKAVTGAAGRKRKAPAAR